jgi:tetratricopeptide (TPR) repeat protein
MYSWDAPKESAHSDVLRRLDPQEFASRAAHDLRLSDDLVVRADSDAAQVQALIARSDAAQLTGDVVSAYRSAVEAVVRAEHAGDAQLLGDARINQATHAMRGDHLSDAIEVLSIAAASAEHAGDHPLLCVAWIHRATCHLAAGETDTALSLLDKAFALGRDHGLTGSKGHALAAAGCAYLAAGNAGATAILNRAQLLHERAGDRRSLGRTYNNIGVVHYGEGRFVDAIPYLERALDLVNVTGDVLTILNTINSNVRAYEQAYLERASEFRDKMEAFAPLLHDRELSRFGDLTALPWAARAAPADQKVSFATDLFVAEPMVLLPIPTSRTEQQPTAMPS